MSFVNCDSLAKQWNLDKNSNTATNVTRVISQATSYASVLGIKYFAISTYSVTWFCCVTAPGAYLISRGYPRDAQSPSVMEMLWNMTVLALSEDRLPAWAPTILPNKNWDDRKRGPKPRNSVIVTEPTSSSSDESAQDEPTKGSFSSSMPSFDDFHPLDIIGHGMCGDVFRGRRVLLFYYIVCHIFFWPPHSLCMNEIAGWVSMRWRSNCQQTR